MHSDKAVTPQYIVWLGCSSSFSSSLPSIQVQVSDVAIPLIVGLLLSASYSLPPVIQSNIICLGLPLDLFPNIFLSITILNSDSPLRVCPIHFFCMVFIVRMRGCIVF